MRRTEHTLTARDILQALQEHRQDLARYTVERIGLFGSYAYGAPQAESDIDLVVEFRDPTLSNFLGLVDYLEGFFGRRVDVLTPMGVDSIRVKHVADEIRHSVRYA